MHKYRKIHVWGRGMIPRGIAKAEEHFINMGFFDHCPGLLKGSGHLTGEYITQITGSKINPLTWSIYQDSGK